MTPFGPLTVGVQTFSVAFVELEPLKLVQHLGQIGSGNVEIAGFLRLYPSVFAHHATQAGVIVQGAMVDHNKLVSDPEFVINRVKPVKPGYVVSTSDHPDEYATTTSRVELAKVINARGQLLKQALEAKLALHHHDFELQPVSSLRPSTLFEDVFDRADPSVAQAVLDTGWIYMSGLDIPDFIRRLAGRVLVLHCKDVSYSDPSRTVPVGMGILDWPRIIDAALDAGVRYLMVELDKSPDPLSETELAINNLQRYVNQVMGQPL